MTKRRAKENPEKSFQERHQLEFKKQLIQGFGKARNNSERTKWILADLEKWCLEEK